MGFELFACPFRKNKIIIKKKSEDLNKECRPDSLQIPHPCFLAVEPSLEKTSHQIIV